ncbi:MAG: osmotically inducible protein OsmC [Elusimicrobia bacterium]|nr:osmotically inducible protein OsmC [Elusimicrobiota bacterium]
MTIRFPGNKKVSAEFGGFTVATDQPVDAGGDGSAPSPFELFLASLGTCAGLFALSFCRKRGLPTEGLELTQTAVWDEAAHRVSKVVLRIRLPKDFPEKYRDSVAAAAALCTVKKHMQAPPDFEIVAEPG